MNPDTSPVFSSLEPDLREEIHGAEIIELEPGTTILRQDEYIKAVPLVIEGSIKLHKTDVTGREIIYYHIEPGETCILSVISSLNRKASKAEATVEKKTRLILLGAERLHEWMDRYPTWRKYIAGLYYNRMAELLSLLDLVVFKSVDTRLVQYLRENAVDNELRITHQQLAGELGTAREVVSRLLKQMENEHIITLERGKIRIKKPL
jgi:CRP/FNR family transcriptional regulator